MPAYLEDYSRTLADKILKASTQDEVKCLCEASVSWLKEQRSTSAEISVFAEKAMDLLRQYNPMNSDIVQWSNISAARIFINRIIKQYHSPVQ